jgi:hypothetical protein
MGLPSHGFRADRLLAVILSLFSATAMARADSMPKLDAVYATKSVFIDDLTFGRDPFFPASGRRRLVPVQPAAPPPKPQAPEVPDHLFVLKGISTYKDDRWALINKYTFAPGEEIDVKVEGSKLKVRCLEVRERSVVIRVGGVSKELFLRSDL